MEMATGFLTTVYGLYKWFTAPPQVVFFAALKLKDRVWSSDFLKLTLVCLANERKHRLYEDLRMQNKVELACSSGKEMKPDETAYITVKGFEILNQEDAELTFRQNGVDETELYLRENRSDKKEAEKTLEISFHSKIDGRFLGKLFICTNTLQFQEDTKIYESVYAMNSYPRGVVVIINLKKCTSSDPTLIQSDRTGSEKDVESVKELFVEYLGFKTIVFEENHLKTPRTILRELQVIAETDEYTNYDCLAVFIMGHGGDDHFYSEDGRPIKLQDVYQIFTRKECSVFRHKPKLFFIHCCRKDTNPGPTRYFKYPDMSDMAVFQSTYIENSSFIQSVVEVFRKYADKEHVAEMISRVNQMVSEKVGDDKTQTPATELMLRKLLYFYPIEKKYHRTAGAEPEHMQQHKAEERQHRLEQQ